MTPPQNSPELNSNARHATARSIIERRWHGISFAKIATELGRSPQELRVLRLTSEYTDQVWAEYGRASHCFSKHQTYSDCVKHIRMFFGTTRAIAKEVLGNDWKAPEPHAIQLQIAL